MSGHSKWSKVKHQKAIEDVKRGQVFSRLTQEITAAAKINPDAEANPILSAAIEKARSLNMPKENIERAIERASGKGLQGGQAFMIEAYAKNGEGLIIKGYTDNKNRSLSEVRHLLSQHGAKVASPGSVSWNFEGENPKVTKPASKELGPLLKALKAYPDVTNVLTDAV